MARSGWRRSSPPRTRASSCRTSTATRPIRAHTEETTGREILAQVPEVDLFVAGLGTGGTLTGVARALKPARPSVRIVAAEPLPGEQVQGLRSLEEGFVPPVLDDPSSTTDSWSAIAMRWSACAGSCARRASSAASPRERRLPSRCGRRASSSAATSSSCCRRRLEIPLRAALDAGSRRSRGRACELAALVTAQPHGD